MILKLDIEHRGLKVYKVYRNDKPGLTRTYFTARSNLGAFTYISIYRGKVLISYLLGKYHSK